MDNGHIFYGALMLCAGLFLLAFIFRMLQKDGNGRTLAGAWVDMTKNGMVSAKERWPSLKKGQKCFLILASVVYGGVVTGAISLGIVVADITADYFLGEKSVTALPFWLDWGGMWMLLTLTIAAIFAYLEFRLKHKKS